MKTSTKQLAMAAAIAVLGGTAMAAAPASKHVHLARSEPMADSTLTAPPAAIRLWFSAPIQVAVTTVRVADSTGAAVATAPARMGTGAGAPVIADVRGQVTDGHYSVAWRTMSRDGHAVSGTFGFAVASATHSH